MSPLSHRIVDVLEKNGVLNRQRLAQLKQFTKHNAGNVLDFCLQEGVETERPIDRYLREVHRLPVVRIEDVQLDLAVVKTLPRSVCFEHVLVAFHLEDNKLYVAMADPDNQDILTFLRQHSKLEVVPFLADRQGILNVLRKAFDSSTSDVREQISLLIERAKTLGTDAETMAKEMPIIKLLDHLIVFALRSHASDLHIEPTDHDLVIRLRVDGLLHETFRLPQQLHAPIIARIKILAKIRIDEHLRPQDARFSYTEGNDNVAVRVSIVPALYGQKCVLRFLDTTSAQLSLDALGLSTTARQGLDSALRRPHGLILVTGPTGSGKTTTLYAMLNALRQDQVNVSTIEDPIEYHLPGVTQIQVNPAVDLSFATGLRSILRQDPDIIMVGEIRDRETASIAINAALTGHLVLSSLHTNTAAAAVTRLLDIGVEPYLIASTLRVVVNQRLVRTVCPNCQQPANDPAHPGAVSGRGCDNCLGTGYIGRTGLFEIFPVSPASQEVIMHRANTADLEKVAVKEGMTTLRQDGQSKIQQGRTTPQEVLRVIE